MRIVFLSNFLNHHQAALSDALWEQTRGNFLFVQTGAMPRERQELGYPILERPYVLRLQEERERILAEIQNADAVIAGSAPEWLIRRRIRAGKLLLRYSERPLRFGAEPLKFLPRLLRWHWRNPPGRPIWLLCASAFAAGDYGKFGLFRGKSFRWGYFPEGKKYDISELLGKKNPAQILWCGRFLELKRPEDALAAVAKLKAEGYDFHLTFLGTGPEKPRLEARIQALGLADRVDLPGARPPEAVRRAMEQAGIFLFTSDRREGWGAVLNEAMNSGCAVVASHAIGSVPYLLEHQKNGLVYSSGDVEALTDRIRELLESAERQRALGAAAYDTIRASWNPETAAQRLVALIRQLLAGEDPALFLEGPCSVAEEMTESWFV